MNARRFVLEFMVISGVALVLFLSVLLSHRAFQKNSLSRQQGDQTTVIPANTTVAPPNWFSDCLDINIPANLTRKEFLAEVWYLAGLDKAMKPEDILFAQKLEEGLRNHRQVEGIASWVMGRGEENVRYRVQLNFKPLASLQDSK